MKTDPLIGAQTLLVAVVSFQTIHKITYALYIHKNNIHSLVFSVIGHPAIHRLENENFICHFFIHPQHPHSSKVQDSLVKAFGFTLEISAK
jgi:hypothetical protein